MPSTTITSKGQVTIPKSIRTLLKLRTGDRLDFVVDSEGVVRIEPATVDARTLEGMLHRRDTRVFSVDDMKSAVRKRVSAKVARK